MPIEKSMIAVMIPVIPNQKKMAPVTPSLAGLALACFCAVVLAFVSSVELDLTIIGVVDLAVFFGAGAEIRENVKSKRLSVNRIFISIHLGSVVRLDEQPMV